MSDYYNHVLLWLKANRPDYVLVGFHYHSSRLMGIADAWGIAYEIIDKETEYT